MPLPDYYAVLELQPGASLEQIKSSYRRLVRLYHPDINHDVQDREIKRINEAYEVLSDTIKRATYDIALLEEKKRDIMIELIIQQREARRHPRKRMTWSQGAKGFVVGLRRGMRGEDLPS